MPTKNENFSNGIPVWLINFTMQQHNTLFMTLRWYVSVIYDIFYKHGFISYRDNRL